MPDTGRFHRNEGLRDDFFMERESAYGAVTVARARSRIDGGLPALDPVKSVVGQGPLGIVVWWGGDDFGVEFSYA